MLVGILSDTHDRLEPTAAALKLLRTAGVTYYVHCGDVGGERVFDLLAGLALAFVWGNTDSQRTALRGYAESLGLACHDDLADLTIDGVRIAVTHGDQPGIIKAIVTGGKHQYLLYGHSHVARDETVNGLRRINPGALHRTARPSVATLDTLSGQLRFIYLKTDV